MHQATGPAHLCVLVVSAGAGAARPIIGGNPPGGIAERGTLRYAPQPLRVGPVSRGRGCCWGMVTLTRQGSEPGCRCHEGRGLVHCWGRPLLVIVLSRCRLLAGQRASGAFTTGRVRHGAARWPDYSVAGWLRIPCPRRRGQGIMYPPARPFSLSSSDVPPHSFRTYILAGSDRWRDTPRGSFAVRPPTRWGRRAGAAAQRRGRLWRSFSAAQEKLRRRWWWSCPRRRRRGGSRRPR